MTVDGVELEQRVRPLERDEIDAKRLEEIFQANLEKRETARIHPGIPEDDPHVQIRSFASHRLPLQPPQPIVLARAEEIDGQEVEFPTDLNEGLLRRHRGQYIVPFFLTSALSYPPVLSPRDLDGRSFPERNAMQDEPAELVAVVSSLAGRLYEGGSR
jgi:hypothetical protein